MPGLDASSNKPQIIFNTCILHSRIINIEMSPPAPNTPVSDPVWLDDLFPFELLDFAVGQVIGNDVGGLGARVVDVELAAMQHHQSA